jgi:ubiquinone/menaquinone biosynthesis C-methylase UbiE
MKKRHEHSGPTSEGLYDPLPIFQRTYLEAGDHVLDAGCGTGHLSMIASRIVGDLGKVHSFDIHEKGIDILKMRIEHGRFRNIEAEVRDVTESLPLEQRSIDLVIFSNVIHGFILNSELDPVLENIDLIVKDTGKVAIVEFRKKETEYGPPIDERFTPEEIGERFEKIGMILDHTENLSDNHYLAVFSRISTG